MSDPLYMRIALKLARRGCGMTSPNPMVGAVLVKDGEIIGRGWHRRAGGPHAEIAALQDTARHGHDPHGATLYVTLEPCCTHGRTPPCTKAIIAVGIRCVVVGTTDPNPQHAGKGLKLLKRAGIEVVLSGKESASPHPSPPIGERVSGGRVRGRSEDELIASECARLNEAFNHWIVQRTPFVTVKAAMTLDGKIATAGGESKWITGEKARAYGMKLRQGSDAILVGVNTILADDPSLTVRAKTKDGGWKIVEPIRRIVLDSLARTPLNAKVVTDEQAAQTTIVVSQRAPKRRVAALARHARILVSPEVKSALRTPRSALNLGWLLKNLGSENVTSLLVEGGGEVNASFLLGGFAQRVAFFYAPKILGGRDSRKAVAGDGVKSLDEAIQLRDVEWRRLGPDLLLTARAG